MGGMDTAIQIVTTISAVGGLVLGAVNLWRDCISRRPRLLVRSWTQDKTPPRCLVVEVTNLGRVATSVSRAGILFADGRALVKPGGMRPAQVKFPHVLQPGATVELDFSFASPDYETYDSPVVPFAELPTGEVFHALPVANLESLDADERLDEKRINARRNAFPRKFRVGAEPRPPLFRRLLLRLCRGAKK